MTTTQTTECLTCQYDARRRAGVELTTAQRNHSMLWGCTCSPADAADALAYMDLVTR